MDATIRFADADALKDPERFAQALARVSDERRDKALQLKDGAARRRSLAAGLLLAEALEAVGVSGADAQLACGQYGKPYLPRRPDVQFSLSHSGAWAMCALAAKAVGCDIQLAAPRSLRVARRYFTAAECERIFSQETEEGRQAMFYRIWTLKESYVKCLGLGLALPLDSFSVLPEEGGAIRLLGQDEPDAFRFSEPEAPEGYFAACCVYDV